MNRYSAEPESSVQYSVQSQSILQDGIRFGCGGVNNLKTGLSNHIDRHRCGNFIFFKVSNLFCCLHDGNISAENHCRVAIHLVGIGHS